MCVCVCVCVCVCETSTGIMDCLGLADCAKNRKLDLGTVDCYVSFFESLYTDCVKVEPQKGKYIY